MYSSHKRRMNMYPKQNGKLAWTLQIVVFPYRAMCDGLSAGFYLGVHGIRNGRVANYFDGYPTCPGLERSRRPHPGCSEK